MFANSAFVVFGALRVKKLQLENDNLPNMEADIITDETWRQDEDSSLVDVDIDEELHVVRVIHDHSLT